MRQAHDSRGATIVFVAAAISLLVIFVAFSIEVGRLVMAKGEAQAAVDAATLAAAAGIPRYATGSDPDGDGITTGDISAFDPLLAGLNVHNQVLGNSPNIQFASDARILDYLGNDITTSGPYTDATGVRITKAFPVPHPFGKILGKDSSVVNATATAQILGAGCMTPTIPVAFLIRDDGQNLECTLNSCQSTTPIQLDFDEAQFSNSLVDNAAYFRPAYVDSDNDGINDDINDNNVNASYCKNAVEGAITIPPLCAGQDVFLNNGTIASCLQEIKQKCLGLGQYSPHCNASVTYPGYNPDGTDRTFPGWEVIAPIIRESDLVNGNPVQSVKIRGFVKVYIQEVEAGANPKFIKFERWCGLITGTPSGGRRCGIDVTNPLAPQLIQ